MLEEIRALARSIDRRTGALMRHSQIKHVQQIEAYLSLITFLQPRFPFPPMDMGAIAPDLALLFASKILESSPSLIVEMGSGISTLVAGYCLQRNNAGRIISLEHDPHWARKTERSIRLHDLSEYVEVIHAPLRAQNIKGDTWVWYDTACLSSIQPGTIDFLFVDGPPGRLRKLSRYPALPFLFEKLSDNPLIFVDDATRTDESQMVGLWLQEYPSLRSVLLKTAKGTSILTFKECHSRK